MYCTGAGSRASTDPPAGTPEPYPEHFDNANLRKLKQFLFLQRVLCIEVYLYMGCCQWFRFPRVSNVSSFGCFLPFRNRVLYPRHLRYSTISTRPHCPFHRSCKCLRCENTERGSLSGSLFCLTGGSRLDNDSSADDVNVSSAL